MNKSKEKPKRPLQDVINELLEYEELERITIFTRKRKKEASCKASKKSG